MGRKGRPKKKKILPKIRYKVGDVVIITTFGNHKQAIIDELDTLEGVRCYNVTTTDGTRWSYVGVDGSGTFFNIDSKLTKLNKQSNGKK